MFWQAFGIANDDVASDDEFDFVFAIEGQTGLAVDVGQAFGNAVQINAVRHFAF